MKGSTFYLPQFEFFKTKAFISILINCLLFTLFTSCTYVNDNKLNLYKKVIDSDTLHKLTIIEESVKGSFFKLFTDSAFKEFYFFENKSMIILKKPTKYDFDLKRYQALSKEKFSELSIVQYDPINDKFFESQEKLIVKDNFILLSLYDAYNFFGRSCYYVIFHHDKKLSNYVILPFYDNKIFENLNDSYAYQSFFDVEHNILVLEVKLYYSGGPYLVSAYKIETDSVRKLFEITSNRDTKYYKYLEKKNEPYIYSRLLLNEAQKSSSNFNQTIHENKLKK